MLDQDSHTYALRRNMIENIALPQVGAHYLLGVLGSAPDYPVPGDNPVHEFSQINLLSNYVNNHARITLPAPDLFAPNIYAARNLTNNYCGGRCNLYLSPLSQFRNPSLRRMYLIPGDLNDLARYAHDKYLWPRRGVTGIVYGESCVRKMHFDCIGYIDWVWSHFRHEHREIFSTRASWYNNSIQVSPDPDPRISAIGADSIWAGDIVFARINYSDNQQSTITSIEHIGLATGGLSRTPARGMVHARSTEYGVLVETIGAHDIVRRFKRIVRAEYQAQNLPFPET